MVSQESVWQISRPSKGETGKEVTLNESLEKETAGEWHQYDTEFPAAEYTLQNNHAK